MPADVLQTVITLRRERLPDPSIEPNVGSFFKNPVIAVEKAADLLRQFPDMPQYPVSQSLMKLSAAWLIDYLGWRGRCEEGVKVSEKHALVLINVSAETSSGIVNVANKIAASVCDEFGVLLEREPVLFGQGEPA